jgi:crotonobetainyl-CoA:carnitine CoA-transferase CaiB-like acyl-CoA transferase
MKLLTGIKVVSLAVNLPGPAAARRFCQLGAQVVKVEPPTGDPMNHYNSSWYDELNAGQEILSLDLKAPVERQFLERNLQDADLLITANRLRRWNDLDLVGRSCMSSFLASAR